MRLHSTYKLISKNFYKMKKILFTACILTLPVLQSSAQHQNDIFIIQNFKNSAVISLTERAYTSVSLSDFGATNRITGSFNNNYLFQGQEFHPHLGIYSFPSRIYSPMEKRFFQPDPKSQYNSPYLFVGADPINIVDRDGEKGKPLVLYEVSQNETADTGINSAILNIQDAAPDAYYYPLTDFVNGKIGALSEWDGRVFIATHSDDKYFEIERSSGLQDIETAKVKGIGKFTVKPSQQLITVDADPEAFGRKLFHFAEKNGTEVSSVNMLSCRGENVAKRIGIGYGEEARDYTKSGKILVGGVDDRYRLATAGKYNTTRPGLVGLDETHMVITEPNPKAYETYDYLPDGRKHLADARLKNVAGIESTERAEASHIKDFIYNDRLPENFRNYKSTTIFY